MTQASLQQLDKALLQVKDYLAQAVESSRARLQSYGITDLDIIDPDASVEQQTLQLRHLFLIAERSSLPFMFGDESFWRVLHARLQPIVLAYQVHEKFVQTLTAPEQALRDDPLMNVYRDRLKNSEKFRDYFFDLNRRLSEQVWDDGDALPQASVHEAVDKNQHGMEDAERIQANVIRSLQEKLREFEKRETRQQKTLAERDKEIYVLQDRNEALTEEVRALEKKLATMAERNLQLEVALDASKRGDRADVTDIEISDANTADSTIDMSQYADLPEDELLGRIMGLERELETTQKAAYNAFMANSDLGIVILFMLTAFKCKNLDELGKEVARSVGTYNIRPCFRMDTDSGRHFYTNIGTVSTANQQMMARHEHEGSQYEHKQELIIYEPSCALLVSDMPMQDPDRAARLKDNLGILMKAAEAAINLLLFSVSVERQKVRMEQLILRSSEVFSKLRNNLEANQSKTQRQLQTFGMDARRALNVVPGDPKSIKLANAMKQLEDGLKPMFKMDKLVDTAFVNNISKVAGTLGKDKH